MPEERRGERSQVEQLVHDAICRKDVSEIRRLASAHPALLARINDPIFGFNSPAIVAFADDDAMVDLLLELGADPNRRSEWWAGGFHALHSATGAAAERLLAAGAVPDACAAAHLDRLDLLTAMVEASPERVHERGGDGKMPLHFARSKAVVDFLLTANADIDARDIDHRSTAAEWMLDRAKGQGRIELARYLVERGASADVFMCAALGVTDRARAMVSGRPELLQLRTGRGPYGEQPPSSYHIYFWTIGSGLSPLDVAAQFEQRETLDALLALATPPQRLVFACRRGDKATAHAMVNAHPGLVQMLTVEEAQVLADVCWTGNVEAVALMLALGFDPRVTGHDAGTPLHLAAWEGSAEIVGLLLDHPDAAQLVDIRDAHYGATPLGWCCHGSLHGNAAHNHAEVARLLLRAGAKPGPDASAASPAVLAVLDPR